MRGNVLRSHLRGEQKRRSDERIELQLQQLFDGKFVLSPCSWHGDEQMLELAVTRWADSESLACLCQ